MNTPPLISSSKLPPRKRSIITGLSGNEMYCLQLKGLRPGELVIGNSVHSLGVIGGKALFTAATKSRRIGDASVLTEPSVTSLMLTAGSATILTNSARISAGL